MPIPSPHSGETESEFISRCAGDKAMNQEFPENDQRLGVCYTSWRRHLGKAGSPMLVGLVAPSGSGKSWASKHLRKRYGFKRVHAGAPVKWGFRKGFGLSRQDVDGKRKDRPNMKLGGVAPRAPLEAMSKGVHDTAPMATTIAMRPKIMRAMGKGRDVVVDGVRSEKEANFIKDQGGHIVGIDTGKSVDPSKPTDLMQADIILDHVVKAEPDKKSVRAGIDKLMTKLMAAG
jgi:hypothetical protein